MLLESPSQRTEHVDHHDYFCTFLWLMNYASSSARHFCTCREGLSRPEAAKRDHTTPLAHHDSSTRSCMHPALAHTRCLEERKPEDRTSEVHWNTPVWALLCRLTTGTCWIHVSSLVLILQNAQGRIPTSIKTYTSNPCQSPRSLHHISSLPDFKYDSTDTFIFPRKFSPKSSPRIPRVRT